MGKKYVNFVTDEHLIACIGILHEAYLRARKNLSRKTFYKNKIDTIKLTFDAEFNSLDEEALIQAEILRQIDKSINNAIGKFHEQVLGGIEGYEVGYLSGFDIKATDGSLFAVFYDNLNNKLEECLFDHLATFARYNKNAKCYWVQLGTNDSFKQIWRGHRGELSYSHKQVYKISGDEFYALLSGEDVALSNLQKALPSAIGDYLSTMRTDVEKLEDIDLNAIFKSFQTIFR